MSIKILKIKMFRFQILSFGNGKHTKKYFSEIPNINANLYPSYANYERRVKVILYNIFRMSAFCVK